LLSCFGDVMQIVFYYTREKQSTWTMGVAGVI